MTAVTLTLSEFLLARIAEDEKYARMCYDDPDCDHESTWWNERRVLAECESKRRIVEMCDRYDGYEVLGDDTLALLALPYADHPDYRPEWRS